jgi:hypothetical protein
MKRKNILRSFLYALIAISLLFSVESCSSGSNYLDKGRSSRYSKVRTRQPNWSSTTSLNTRYKKKKNRGKHTTKKRAKYNATTKSQEYNPKD